MLFLWIMPHLLLGLLAAIFWRRRLYREFPCFFAYLLYEMAEFFLLFASRFVFGVSMDKYSYIFAATLMVSVALRFGMIDEVSKDLFRESDFLKVAARRMLQAVTGVLLVMAILLAVYAPGNNGAKWVAGVFVVNRGATMVQCGLLLTLLLFSRFSGLSWRRPAFGIALGLGVLASVDLAMYAIRAEFPGDAARLVSNLLITGTYLVCVLIWIVYVLAPEPKPVSFTVVSHDEVEIWNTELQQLLRQ